ncbi:ComF family protein [Arcanobacterium phocae]|uniref:ComF family protein n=3 Tax=Arcanobacterium phocae TaxID=131112 RepID=UPI001C0F20B6
MSVYKAIRRFYMQCMDIVFPRWCVGCAVADESLCDRCMSAWSGPWWRAESNAQYLLRVDSEGEDITAFPVWGKAWYRGVVADSVVAWKNRADRRLDCAFAQLISDALQELNVGHAFPAARWDRVVIVPVASSWVRKHQGSFVTGVIARVVGEQLGVAVVDGLRKGAVRLRLHNARERAVKSREQYAVRDFSGRDVILVDDVLTTGATLNGAERAVTRAGGRVVGAIVLAVTDHP